MSSSLKKHLQDARLTNLAVTPAFLYQNGAYLNKYKQDIDGEAANLE